MPRHLILAIALLLAPLAAHAQSPFTGMWAGTWSDKSLNQSGKASITIDPAGRIVGGSVVNTTFAASSPLAGTIQDNGQATFTYSYDGGRTVYRGNGRFILKGPELVGDIDFLAPNNRIFGHGRFAFARLDNAPAPNLPPPAPPTPRQQEGNAAVSAQERTARP